jgi:hypothetical protein
MAGNIEQAMPAGKHCDRRIFRDSRLQRPPLEGNGLAEQY